MPKRTVLLLINFFLIIHSSYSKATNNILSVIIENKSDVTYSDKVIAIPWQQLKMAYSSIDTADLKITDAASYKEIEYQLEYAGNNDVQNLLVQVSINPKSAVKLILQKGKHGLFTTKTYGRYVPERKDDFAWENDKIAFRMYGKALESTPAENGYGIDVWVKRTGRMILNERYKRGEYHIDHGDGMDYYHVGYSLGAGNTMPFINDSIWYSKNYVSWKMLDNGPLRTTFILGYDAWNADGKKMTAAKTITLDAGAQLNKITVRYNYEGSDSFAVVAGIVKRAEPGIELLNEEKGVLGYWEPQHGQDGTTGAGCIIPFPIKEMQVKNNQLLVFFNIHNKEPFTYFTGACWNKADEIKSGAQWFDYLQQQQLLTHNNLTIKVEHQ